MFLPVFLLFPWWNCPRIAQKHRKLFSNSCSRTMMVVECTFGRRRGRRCVRKRNGSTTEEVPEVATACCALWCLHGRSREHYLNKWTQKTCTFPQPYIIVEVNCAHWSQTKLDTAFQISCWYLIPWNQGKVYQANRIVRTVCSHYLKPSHSQSHQTKERETVHVYKLIPVSMALLFFPPLHLCKSHPHFSPLPAHTEERVGGEQSVAVPEDRSCVRWGHESGGKRPASGMWQEHFTGCLKSAAFIVLCKKNKRFHLCRHIELSSHKI